MIEHFTDEVTFMFHILVADDDKNTRLFLRAVLEDAVHISPTANVFLPLIAVSFMVSVYHHGFSKSR